MSFMPMEASASVNTKPARTCGQLLSHCYHSRDEIWPPEQNNNIFVTSRISIMLEPVTRASFQSSLFTIHGTSSMRPVATSNVQSILEIPATDEIHMEDRNHGLA